MNRLPSLLRSGYVGVQRYSARTMAGIPVDDVLMGLSDDHIELRHMVRNFFEAELEPFASDIDKNDHFPQFREFWKKCGEMGMHGVTAPEEYGGINMGYLAHVLVMEEMSRVAGGIALSYGAHSNLCINQIVRNGTDAQREQYLPKLISGEHIGMIFPLFERLNFTILRRVGNERIWIWVRCNEHENQSRKERRSLYPEWNKNVDYKWPHSRHINYIRKNR